MQPSDDTRQVPGQGLAILAEALYVANLLVAMAGQCWRFPVIGPRLPHTCEAGCVRDHKD